MGRQKSDNVLICYDIKIMSLHKEGIKSSSNYRGSHFELLLNRVSQKQYITKMVNWACMFYYREPPIEYRTSNIAKTIYQNPHNWKNKKDRAKAFKYIQKYFDSPKIKHGITKAPNQLIGREMESYVASWFQRLEMVRELEMNNVLSSDEGKRPSQLGIGGFNKRWCVYVDASKSVYKQEPLTPFEVDIMRSHEAGHCFRTLYLQDKDSMPLYEQEYLERLFSIKSLREIDSLSTWKSAVYLTNSYNEILERCSQVLNYFQIIDTQDFTVEHLKYAK